MDNLDIANALCSDNDDSSKSVYSNAIDPYNLPTEAELFKVWNKILRNNILWDFALQWSWFYLDDDGFKDISMFCSCGRTYKKWLEEEGLIDFLKKI